MTWAAHETGPSAKSQAKGEERARRSGRQVRFFFSNRLGCAGSLLVTVLLSALLFLLMRGCSGPGRIRPSSFNRRRT